MFSQLKRITNSPSEARFGDPSVLGIVTVQQPSPGPGQVLVRVAAATVNPTDLGFRHGGRALPPGTEPPYIPGMDLAGVIDAVGPSVRSWLADLVTKGVLTFRVADVLPASSAAAAHRRLEAGGVRGRLVLTF